MKSANINNSIVSTKSMSILKDKSNYKSYYSDANWDRKDLFSDVRHSQKSINDYLKQKEYEEQVI